MQAVTQAVVPNSPVLLHFTNDSHSVATTTTGVAFRLVVYPPQLPLFNMPEFFFILYCCSLLPLQQILIGAVGTFHQTEDNVSHLNRGPL